VETQKDYKITYTIIKDEIIKAIIKDNLMPYEYVWFI
jgi:hypothetical protein